jgi:hypothetical protein
VPDPQELYRRASEARALLRRLADLVESGELEATPARIWHLRGALDAVEALLDCHPVRTDLNDR